MCDEHVDIWKAKWRIARKRHSCCECGDGINPCDKYYWVKTFYEGRWDTYAMCMICEAHWGVFKGAFDGCIQIEGLTEIEGETQYDVADQFVLLDMNVAEFAKEQFYEQQ